MKKTTILIIIAAVIAAICGAVLLGFLLFGIGSAGPTSHAGLANPASVHCADIGGTLDIVDEAGGQVGYCHLPDGRVCEEWNLFRDNACTPPRAK